MSDGIPYPDCLICGEALFCRTGRVHQSCVVIDCPHKLGGCKTCTDASIRIATLRTQVEELEKENQLLRKDIEWGCLENGKIGNSYMKALHKNKSLESIVEKAREEISNIKCVCDEAWTARDRHSGDCARGMIEFHLEDTIDALAKLKEMEDE